MDIANVLMADGVEVEGESGHALSGSDLSLGVKDRQ